MSPHRKIRCLSYGLGAIGRALALRALESPWIEWAGAVDIDPEKAGQDAGQVLGLKSSLGIPVSDDPEGTLLKVKPEVVLHTTSSFYEDVRPQILVAVEAGCRIVSSAEELSFLPLQHPEEARRLDELAKGRGVAVMGTGVNPGLVMDRLVLDLARNCLEIENIQAERVVDLASRRAPLQRKMGVSSKDFQKDLASPRFGHAGLRESVALIAHGLGWKLDAVEEEKKAILAERDFLAGSLEVGRGEVAGVEQRAKGFLSGEAAINLLLQMRIGAPDPHDAIAVEGAPSVRMQIPGGIRGDEATIAILLRAVQDILSAPPGLRTATGFGAFDEIPPVPRRSG